MKIGTAKYLRGVDSNGNSINVTIASVIANCLRGDYVVINGTSKINTLPTGFYAYYVEAGLPEEMPTGVVRGELWVINLMHAHQFCLDTSGVYYRTSDTIMSEDGWRKWTKL